MLNLEELQRDIQELPEEAQNLLADFVEILRKRYSKPTQPEFRPGQSAYQNFKDSGLIGFVSVDENLSKTYKQVLSEQLNTKYDHC